MPVKKMTIATIFAIILCVGPVIYFYDDIFLEIRKIKYESALEENMVNNNPDKIRSFLIKDIEDGINDDYTRSAIFLVISRYVSNGGNIYEVFDFIKANPEFSFLEKAEVIYPIIFDDLKKRDLQLTYSDKGLYVYLAYLETLVENDYGSNAVFGTLIGQYAKSAYYKKTIVNEKSKGGAKGYPNYSKEEIEHDVSKAILFIDKYRNNIISSMNATSSLNSITERDLLEGVIQYASGLRYLDELGVNPVKVTESREMFDFATRYSHYYVRDLYLFVSLSNASTLLLSSSSTSNELRNAVYPFLNFDSKKDKPKGIVAWIIGAKYQQSASKFADLSIGSKKNIVSLGNKVLEFKKWLIYSGWNENDFK